MALRHSNASLIPAVGYLRCSTDKQDESVDIQKNEIIKYAKRERYQIVDWYIDDGISGHDEDRPGFVRLLADAKLATWRFVIVRNQSRFSRIRPATLISYLDQLDCAGVSLVSTDRGVIDINDFVSLLLATIEANRDNEYSKTLSKLTIGGQVKRAEQGYSAGQNAPYAMDRMYVDESGAHRQRVKNGQDFAKPKSWRVIFVPSDNEHDVATVRWIFDQYANHYRGYSQIASDLNARGIPSPRGGDWVAGTIRAILKNEKYAGDYSWNKTRQGKFNAYQSEETRARPASDADRSKKGRRKTKVKRNDPSDWVGKQNVYDAIVDRSVFDKVQEIMEQRKNHDGRPRRNEYILSGLVYCSHCGGKMHGTAGTRKKGGKTYRWPKYCCSTFQKNRSCKNNRADAGELHRIVVEKIVQMLRAPDNVERLRRAMDARAKLNSTDFVDKVSHLRKQIKDLTAKIDRGTKRVFSAPDDMVDALYAELSDLKQRRQVAEEELAEIGNLENRPVKWTADDVVELLGRLADELASCSPDMLKAALAKVVDRIELKFETIPRGKGTTQRLVGGIIHLAESQVIRMAGTGFEPATSRL